VLLLPLCKVTFDSANRLLWTSELHNQFVSAVNQLGGADKAMPSGILKLMPVKGLTIDHIRGHLKIHRSKVRLQETNCASSAAACEKQPPPVQAPQQLSAACRHTKTGTASSRSRAPLK
jgi:SHAQKYF class myb-like DNA-binding protein